MALRAVHPIEALREHATALEAAMTVALAKPRKTAVHDVRTLVRRLEAQIELLRQLAALPTESAEADGLRRELRKLRRAAGRVRDLDVQRNTLKTQAGLPKRAAAHLREELKAARKERAEKLQRVLLKQLPRVVGALEQVVESLSTANGLVLPALRLAPLVERWTLSRESSVPAASLDDDEPHTRRKTAKTARYMMETPEGTTANAASRYEEEQDAGGRWHDWMDLEATSRGSTSEKHRLTLAAGEHCKRSRAAYVKLLERAGRAGWQVYRSMSG